MAGETTFTMKEARARYIGVFALLIFFASIFGFFPIAFIVAAALQGCLFRLSKPSALAFLPSVLLLPLLFFFYGIQSAIILTALLAAVGLVLRIAQTKAISKNVTVASLTCVFVAAAVLAFSIWLWQRNALSVDGLRSFFEAFQNALMAELRAWFENAGASANVSSEDIEALLAMTEQSLSDLVLLLPCLLSIFFFAVSCAVIGIYKLVCRIFRMKSGLSDENWRFSVSMPFAAFYVLLLIFSFFLSGTSTFALMCANLRVLLSVFIAIVGVSMLIDALRRAFPRISSRFFIVVAILFLCFSTYSVLVWQIIAAVTAVKVIIAAFRKPTHEE